MIIRLINVNINMLIGRKSLIRLISVNTSFIFRSYFREMHYVKVVVFAVTSVRVRGTKILEVVRRRYD